MLTGMTSGTGWDNLAKHVRDASERTGLTPGNVHGRTVKVSPGGGMAKGTFEKILAGRPVKANLDPLMDYFNWTRKSADIMLSGGEPVHRLVPESRDQILEFLGELARLMEGSAATIRQAIERFGP